MQNPAFSIRSKIWIVDPGGQVIFGLGRLRILEAVARQGSIQAAAAELKMSYRAVWGRLKATEARLGRPLLVRNIGGAAGGGSRLTPFAQALVEHFRALQREMNADADHLFEARLGGLFALYPPADAG